MTFLTLPAPGAHGVDMFTPCEYTFQAHRQESQGRIQKLEMHNLPGHAGSSEVQPAEQEVMQSTHVMRFN